MKLLKNRWTMTLAVSTIPVLAAFTGWNKCSKVIEITSKQPVQTPAAAVGEAQVTAGQSVGGAGGQLEIIEINGGNGAAASEGKHVSVHYSGTLENGIKFDSSRDRDGPYSFTLGEGQVIAGWEQGIKGMKVGGRRKLVIPPQLGYGEKGVTGVIPPNAKLLYEVELIEVENCPPDEAFTLFEERKSGDTARGSYKIIRSDNCEVIVRDDNDQYHAFYIDLTRSLQEKLLTKNDLKEKGIKIEPLPPEKLPKHKNLAPISKVRVIYASEDSWVDISPRVRSVQIPATLSRGMSDVMDVSEEREKMEWSDMPYPNSLLVTAQSLDRVRVQSRAVYAIQVSDEGPHYELTGIPAYSEWVPLPIDKTGRVDLITPGLKTAPELPNEAIRNAIAETIGGRDVDHWYNLYLESKKNGSPWVQVLLQVSIHDGWYASSEQLISFELITGD